MKRMHNVMNPRFKKHQEGNVTYFTFEHFDNTDLLTHCFTSRIGGVSYAPYEGLNLGFNSGDDVEAVTENHALLANALHISKTDFVYTKQVHDIQIFKVDEHFEPAGDQSSIERIDGLITDHPSFALHTVYADCVPVYVLDPVHKAIGMAHSGWRGTVGKIGKVLVESMADAFGTRPADCLAGIGPSIGPCCFEVGKEVTKAFEDAFDDQAYYHVPMDQGKDHVNLWESNKQVLIEAGIPHKGIICAEMCTCCNETYFYSYRRDKGSTGRMAGIMKLKNPTK